MKSINLLKEKSIILFAKIKYNFKTSPGNILRFIIGLILTFVVLSGIIYHFFDLDIVEYFPKYQFCIFKIITKKPCPGCGMTRAFLSIGKFELLKAFEFNFFSIPLFIFMSYYLLKAKVPEFFKYKSIQIAVLFLVILIWIFRLNY